MSDTVLQKTIALRAEVWGDLVKSPAFQSFKALDAAVAAMGGKRILLSESPLEEEPSRSRVGATAPVQRRRGSQGDAAEQVLLNSNEPLQIRVLLDAVLSMGVEVRGEDPLANFRSTLSRDPRFKSIMHKGGYFWWLTDVALPEGWDEAEADDLVARLASASSSDHSSQEGGGGHAANNTVLAS
ncbi:hypothetical protein [Erythrobacter donghaensis]|uniref:hypothetical protein n=1 Tax=Erythrobacter donghaensis TaxID=267135 RepID=UPI00117F6B73|nr:hypothetical protein [Erythrobacter donghaensis]